MHAELYRVQPGFVFANRYRIVSLIRAGGMGAVYDVEDTVTQRHRALKVMLPNLVQSPDLRARFEREVRVGAVIESDHVVEVFDAGVEPQTGLPYLTMELLRGEELGDRLKRVSVLSPEETVQILTQVARAIDRAHQRNIVHRDLKPENVFLTYREDGSLHVKVLDFGIAKLMEGANTGSTKPAGTPHYMAPEQTDRHGVSGATDVWAIGLMAYTMLVGRPYWRSEALNPLFKELLMDPLVSAEQRAHEDGRPLPRGFDAFFFRCVDRDPRNRFASAREAVAALGAAFGLGAMAPTPQPPQASYGKQSSGTVMMPPDIPWPAQDDGRLASGANLPAYDPRTASGANLPAYDPRTASNANLPAYDPRTASGANLPAYDPRASSGTIVGAGTPPPTHLTPAHIPVAPPAAPVSVRGGPPWALLGAGAGALVVAAIVVAMVLPGKKAQEPVPSPPASAPAASVDEDAPKGGKKKKEKETLKDKIEKTNEFLPITGKSFALQQHEVSRGEWALWVEESKGKAKPASGSGTDAKPVTNVDVPSAEAFCQAIDARLPSAAEWDAALGSDKYPWGKTWKASGLVAVNKPKGTPLADVGTSFDDRGPFGHLDLAGNVRELTSTPGPGDPTSRLLRGSDIEHGENEFLHPTTLWLPGPDVAASAAADPLVGFRCAR